MKQRSAVSLAFELGEILDAVTGVQLLARELQGPGGRDDPDYPQTIASALAGLAMVMARLKVVVTAIRNEVDPATILAPHNAVLGDHGQPDVLLRPWSAEQVAENGRQVVQLAERQVRRRRRGGR